MRRLHLLVVSLLAAAHSFTHADTFTLSAAFSNGDTAAGTLNLDTTTGLILGGAATISTSTGSFVSNTTLSAGPANMGIQRSRGSFDALLVYQGPGSPFASTFIQLDLPTTTLVGYAGSNIVINGNFSNLIFSGQLPFALTSGALTAAAPSTITPEPSSLLLLGTGLLSLSALPRRRKRA